MAYSVLIALICASFAVLPAGAKEETIRARVYATDSTVGDLTSVTAGKTFTTNFIVNDQVTNATLGDIMGFCVALRPQGHVPVDCPASCWYLAGTGLYTGATGYFQELNPYPAPESSGPAESA